MKKIPIFKKPHAKYKKTDLFSQNNCQKDRALYLMMTSLKHCQMKYCKNMQNSTTFAD